MHFNDPLCVINANQAISEPLVSLVRAPFVSPDGGCYPNHHLYPGISLCAYES